MAQCGRCLLRGQSARRPPLFHIRHWHPVGEVIGREGRTAWYLTHRSACFAATDRSYEGGCVQCGPVTATNPPRKSAPLGFWYTLSPNSGSTASR